MTSAEAKRILIAHRPGAAADAGVAAALEQVQRDPELWEWWRQQQQFHAAMEKGFGEIPVPAGLRDRIRARAKLIPLPVWRRPRVLAAAAGIVLLLGLSALLWWPAHKDGSFATFRSRMVSAVLRQYRMDIETNDMASIQKYLVGQKAPTDPAVLSGLTLAPTGAGLLSWKASSVSMVCFDGGAQGTVFLFIADASEMRDPPGQRDFTQVNKLMTVSWTERGKVYVLATHGGRETLEKYFP
jgi:hypothetical protein